MKKFISLLTSSVLLTTVSASSAFAEETGTDYELTLNSYVGSIYNVTATNSDGTTYNPAEDRDDSLSEYLTYVNGAVEIRVDEESRYGDTMSKYFKVGFKNEKRDINVENCFPANILTNDKELIFQNHFSSPYDQRYYIIEIASGENKWSFDGYLETDEEIKITFVDNGLIVNSDSENPINIDLLKKSDEDDWKNCDNLGVTGSFMLTADENNTAVLSIDPDNDGVYDAVEKGDVNNDGVVNASDASAVLAAYSQLSTGGRTYIYSYAADYNGDGIINAKDATGILAAYAESSVQS
ncbi:MAG: dockerin type I domain-containing protein [Ruminococcus flavefaciens]|nr:dockerin type I domain-containing protein [Ruminococcus flavefaciens]MCM1230611.1 dockerin type I domain-containing protein [Ruminococcus flavefaciens]